ncbi:MAG: AAA-associated domain-containing protein, partial [Thermoproteota archaeon]
DFVKTESDLTPFIPQADDFQKVLEFPVKVSQGLTDSKAIAKAFDFTIRQSSYYRQAAEMLGLVVEKNNQYELTAEGRKFLQLSTPERHKMACELLFRHPIMHEVLQHLINHPNKPVSYDEVRNIINQKSKLRGATVKRRTQTIFKWFKWIQQTTGIINVKEKEVWLAGMCH